MHFRSVLRLPLHCATESKEEKVDSGVETQSSEGAVEEVFGPKCFYNKAKSFFDNISSELQARYECSSCRATVLHTEPALLLLHNVKEALKYQSEEQFYQKLLKFCVEQYPLRMNP